MARSAPRILIVGAGPTGLTAAVELARQGLVADVIEKRETPSPFSRAVGLLPQSMALLEHSGAAEAIRARAIEITKAVVHKRARAFAHIPVDQLADPHHRLLALPQDETEDCLRAAFERYCGRVRYDTELTGFDETPDDIRAKIGGKTERYDFIIGADGIRSRVRETAGIAYLGADLPQAWSIADADVADWRGMTEFRIYLLAQGEAALVVPLGPNRVRIVTTEPDAIRTLPVPMRILNVRRKGSFKISIRQATKYQKGRVFLAGDAAHCHSPVGGRGMNLGIADAADLARRFIENDLSGYHAARHKVGREVIKTSEQARGILMSSNPLSRGFAGLAMKFAAGNDGINRRFTRALLNV